MHEFIHILLCFCIWIVSRLHCMHTARSMMMTTDDVGASTNVPLQCDTGCHKISTIVLTDCLAIFTVIENILYKYIISETANLI